MTPPVASDSCQRWLLRREFRRPAGEPIRTSLFDVVEIESDSVARDFVKAHHYSGEMSAAVHRYGLMQRGELAGVAVFGIVPSMAAHNKVFPTFTLEDALDLGRFVLLDSVPGNGESWFLARCFELLRRSGVAAIESCADPEPRKLPNGTVLFPGHVGCIYQATNGRYVGRTNPASLRIFPDGTVFSNKSSGKIRHRLQGYQGSVAKLVKWGATPLRDDEDSAAWVERWRAVLTVGHRHQGNHRYVWALDKRRERELPGVGGKVYGPLLPYPKMMLEAA